MSPYEKTYPDGSNNENEDDCKNYDDVDYIHS